MVYVRCEKKSLVWVIEQWIFSPRSELVTESGFVGYLVSRKMSLMQVELGFYSFFAIFFIFDDFCAFDMFYFWKIIYVIFQTFCKKWRKDLFKLALNPFFSMALSKPKSDLSLKVWYFQKTLNHIFAFLGELFWILEISD